MKLARTLLAALCIAGATLVASSSAKTAHRTGVSAQVALDWNINAVNTIRAAVTTVDGARAPALSDRGIDLSLVRAGGGVRRRRRDRGPLSALRVLALRASRGLARRGRGCGSP